MIGSEYFRNDFTNDESVFEFKHKRSRSIRHTASRQLSSICLSEVVEDVKHGEERSRLHLNRRSQAEIIVPNLKSLHNNDQQEISEKTEYNIFHYDFILSNVFGYQWVNVMREGGTFEVFEPIK